MAYINHQHCDKCNKVTQHCDHQCISCRDRIPDNRCQMCGSVFHSTDSHINSHKATTQNTATIERLQKELSQSDVSNAHYECDYRQLCDAAGIDFDATDHPDRVKHIKQLQTRVDQLEGEMKLAKEILAGARELNMSNYTEDEVAALNDAASRAWNVLERTPTTGSAFVKVEKVREVLAEYLSYKSLDGNPKRQQLRQELQTFLSTLKESQKGQQ